MSDGTKIEWTDATWNPITGCSVVSPGCTNCYAMRLAGTRLRHHPSRAGLTMDTKAGPVWTGETRLNEQWLDQPLRWRRPRMIFVCAHGDLFHESVQDEDIDRVFAVLERARHHTFQVLTKRSARMRAYYEDGLTASRVAVQVDRLGAGFDGFSWPPPNVWLGVSAEDQTRADERIPDLLATPAAVRWVSAEPLLGPIDLWGARYRYPKGHLAGAVGNWGMSPRLDWIVAGGESGPGARPMHPDWARSIRDQCQAAGVPFHFKQWGEWAQCAGYQDHVGVDLGGRQHGYASIHAPDTTPMRRVGKKRAGRLLDGREWNEWPRTAKAAAA